MATALGSTYPAWRRNWRTSLVSFRPLPTRSPNACSTDFMRSRRCCRRRRVSVSSAPPMAARSSSCARVPLFVLWNRSIVSDRTATPVSTAMMRSMGRSDLDVDDLSDPEEAGKLQDQRDSNQNLADRIREQHHHVFRIDHVQNTEKHERKQGEQVAGHPALRGVHLD